MTDTKHSAVEREQFEAWCRSKGKDDHDMQRCTLHASKITGCDYSWGDIEARWDAWQARAAIAQGFHDQGRDLAQRCLTAMRQAVYYGETGRGRPPKQTCAQEIEELSAILSVNQTVPVAAIAAAAPDDELLETAYSTMLWLYHRLPSGYARVPCIDNSIKEVGRAIGSDAEPFLAQRPKDHVAFAAPKAALTDEQIIAIAYGKFFPLWSAANNEDLVEFARAIAAESGINAALVESLRAMIAYLTEPCGADTIIAVDGDQMSAFFEKLDRDRDATVAKARAALAAAGVTTS